MLGLLAFHAACNSFLQLALAGAFFGNHIYVKGVLNYD